MRTTSRVIALAFVASLAGFGMVGGAGSASAQEIICSGNLLDDVLSVNLPVASPGSAQETCDGTATP
ncbi:hypothetical protein [Microtetraspora sp. NBRC 13810]|uniref:hypothetical protein n=1 Tax=Microtetraspora sp. NBRC 13810 TaxID=3030990 RepID=UPI002557B268|nr:hypothetical protein [Microtetraspora sp. NBRC 13810]